VFDDRWLTLIVGAILQSFNGKVSTLYNGTAATFEALLVQLSVGFGKILCKVFLLLFTLFALVSLFTYRNNILFYVLFHPQCPTPRIA